MTINDIPNQIINGRLTPLALSGVDCIVLHHMAHKTADVKTVEQWHIQNGWNAIGYNYWIGFDGTVYRGRGLNVGAAVLNNNSHCISIGFQGDYESNAQSMPDAQFNAGVELILYLMQEVKSVKKIVGHKYFGGSVCPGRYFPLEEMQKLKKREDDEMIYNYIDENMPRWARETIKKLVDKGYLKGDENGELGLNDTMLKVFVVNDRAGLYDR